MAETKGHVFVSGGNGFVASHILSQLVEVWSSAFAINDYSKLTGIQGGFQTVASVRSDAKAQEVLDLHPDWKGKVSFVAVPDIGADKAFNHVFKKGETKFDYVIHTASPVDFTATDFQKDLIDPAVKG